MDHEDSNSQKPATVLKGDVFYFDRLVLRNSSVGHSCRIYYRSPEAGGIPFQWEKQPGTAKYSPENDIIPPLTPPPASQSLSLDLPAKPCIDQFKDAKWRVRFWKRSKKKEHKNYVSVPGDQKVAHANEVSSDKFRSLEFFNSDTEIVGSIRDSSSLVSPSSSSSSNCQRQVFGKDSVIEGPFVCSSRPWNMITSIQLVRVVRRV